MLSRRWLVNGLLIVVIAILAAIGYRLDSTAGPQSPQPKNTFDTATVERIEITTADELLVLQRRPSGWILLEPVRWPADDAGVERLFRVVDTGTTRPLEATDSDLARLGLDAPLATLQLGETRVRFGTVNNIGARRYTQIDTALYLLPDQHLPLILQGFAGFIDRHLLPAGFDVSTLRLPGLVLRRDADGNWQAGEREAFASGTLAALIDNWQRLEPTRIGVYEDPRAPSGRVVAESKAGDSIELLLLTTTPEMVIANPALGLQYHFRGEQYERLFIPADE